MIIIIIFALPLKSAEDLDSINLILVDGGAELFTGLLSTAQDISDL